MRSSLFRLLILVVLVACCVVTAASHAQQPPRLDGADRGPLSYHSERVASSIDVWRALAASFDFEVVFAPGFVDTDVELTIEGATLSRVLDRLALAGQQIWTPLDGKTVLVANDTLPRSATEVAMGSAAESAMESLPRPTAIRAAVGDRLARHPRQHEQR